MVTRAMTTTTPSVSTRAVVSLTALSLIHI